MDQKEPNEEVENKAVDKPNEGVTEIYEEIKEKDEVEHQEKKINELCLAGAANRGIAYIGALSYLIENNLLDLKKFVGVSIGSLIGVLYIIGVDMKELFEDVIKLDISEFQDISIGAVFNKGSILNGEKYRIWVWQMLSAKIDPMTNIETIYNNYNVDIIIGAVSLDSGKDGLEYFSKDSNPKMPIFYAIMASMAIPFIFPPIFYNGKRYVDGGVLDNFPMDLLSDNAIGITVTSEQVEADIANLSYVIKLMQLASHRLSSLRSYKGTKIEINAADFNMINFNMTIDNKVTLYYRGYNTVKNHFLLINSDI